MSLRSVYYWDVFTHILFIHANITHELFRIVCHLDKATWIVLQVFKLCSKRIVLQVFKLCSKRIVLQVFKLCSKRIVLQVFKFCSKRIVGIAVVQTLFKTNSIAGVQTPFKTRSLALKQMTMECSLLRQLFMIQIYLSHSCAITWHPKSLSKLPWMYNLLKYQQS